MYAMRPLRNFKTNQCCHLIVAADTREAFGGARRSRAESRRPSRIANRANFFTARYLTPLTKSGYIAVAGGEKNRYLPGKQYRILRKGKAVVRA